MLPPDAQNGYKSQGGVNLGRCSYASTTISVGDNQKKGHSKGHYAGAWEYLGTLGMGLRTFI